MKFLSARIVALAIHGVLTALAAPARPAAAAPETTPAIVDIERLTSVYSVARALTEGVTCPPGEDVVATQATANQAVRAHAQAAAMLDAAARHYPANDGKTDPIVYRQRFTALIQLALASYEQAYTCHPGYHQRHHLESALALLDERTRQILVDEKRPTTDPDFEELMLRRDTLVRLIPAPPLPPQVVERERPARRSEPPPEPTGYARYAGFLVLRPELGFGFGRLQATYPDDEVYGPSAFRGIYFALHAAARFTLGARRNHAVSIGGVYSVQQVAPYPRFDEEPFLRSLSAGGLRLEFALHAHPRWFSIHPAVEFGVQVYLGAEKFGRPYVGPGLGLCLDRELVCFNFKGALSPNLGGSEAVLDVGRIGLAVDLMRIVDRRKGLAKP